MPIQSSAFRLKRELQEGDIHHVCKPDPDAKKENLCFFHKKIGKDGFKCAKMKQYEILMQIGISEDDIPTFTDPLHWLNFFPPEGKQDLIDFGIATDWRRSFITTSENPFYDSFIRW